MKNLLLIIAGLVLTTTNAFANTALNNKENKENNEAVMVEDHDEQLTTALLMNITFGAEKEMVKQEIAALVLAQEMVVFKNGHGKNQAVSHILAEGGLRHAVFVKNVFENGVLTGLDGFIKCPDLALRHRIFENLVEGFQKQNGAIYNQRCFKIEWVVGTQKLQIDMKENGISLVNEIL